MTISITSTDVEGIIEVADSISLTPFIDAAIDLVTQCCTNLDDDYTNIQLNRIAVWLAAHFYTVRDMRTESEKAGSVGEKFQSKVDVGFSTSHYGQMAMRLDYKGGLARLDNKLKKGGSSPKMTWVGKEEDDI